MTSIAAQHRPAAGDGGNGDNHDNGGSDTDGDVCQVTAVRAQCWWRR